MLATIDNAIRISDPIPDHLRRRILAELSPPNPDKPRAISELVRGAENLPDTLDLWAVENGALVLPRGFAHRLEALACDVGEEITWRSAMTLLPPAEHLFRDWSPAQLREYQEPARNKMLEWAQGLMKMDTGGGKTRTTYEVLRWAGQRSIIFVHTTALMRQWEEVAREVYGYQPGIVGEGQWDERDLTIVMRQTLWSRSDLPRSWYAQWGAVVVDEAHHASAETLFLLINRFPAFYRFGVSATPEWDETLFPIIEAVIGPVIHVADAAEALHTPTVRLLETEFDFDYVPTHLEGRKRVQNNYSEMMSALVWDPHRNQQIARETLAEVAAGHHVLIVTRRKEHVERLVAYLGDVLTLNEQMFVLTGSQTGRDAQRIAKRIAAADAGTVLISTVADEALDIPRLDRLVMAFPLRKLPLVEQQAGRIRRRFDGKNDAVIIDVVDVRQNLLRTQCRDRRQLYMRREWPMKVGVAA